MKRVLSILTLLFLASSQLLAQEDVLIKFDDEKVTAAEFKRVYLKNNSGEMVEKSTVDEYLDLYINFKLKVKEAEARGYDTINQFQEELAGYRKQLAQPYLSAEGMIETLKKEAYERLEEEIRASHILISSSLTDAPEDTLAAYKKAKEAKRKLERGENFESIALQYSEDPSVQSNKGDLGYFTAFYMVYPFESAAYETKVGEISEIVRTRFGYHLIKVHDRRPNSGEYTVAHILISTDPEVSKISDPEAKINEIYMMAKGGTPFEELAQKYSDDTRSAQKGGQLPIFGVGKMVKPFEEATFALEKDGDISEPFQTQFGWHIVKRLKKDKMGTYEEIEQLIDQKVRKDSRSKLSQSAVLKKIKNQYGFNENPSAKEDFYKVIDSTYFTGQWNPKKAKGLDKELFTIGERKVTQADFADYFNETQGGSRPMDIRVLVNDRYKLFREQQILDYKDQQLENEYPEFKALIEEYHDGILLFNLTDDLVWSKASKDTTGLKKFYEKNKENYRWGARIDATIYLLKNEEVSNQVKEFIQEGLSPDSIMKIVNQASQLNLKYEEGLYEKDDRPNLEQMEWKKGNVKAFERNGRVELVHIHDVLKPAYKELKEARGMVISDYQEQLEKDWIKKLRKEYSFKVDQEVLEDLKQELN